MSKKIVNRVYDTYNDAVETVQALEANGVSPNDISLVANNVDKHYDPVHQDAGTKGAEGGAATGAVLGGGAGLLAGLGMLAIPGVGPVVAAGWLIATAAGAVAGAGTGAVAGGIIGKLSEYEVSKKDAEFYLETIRRGGALVSVKTNDKTRVIAEDIMSRAAIDESTREQAYKANNWTAYDPAAPVYTTAEIERERDQYRS